MLVENSIATANCLLESENIFVFVDKINSGDLFSDDIESDGS